MGLSLAAITAEDVLPHVLKKVRFGTLDELYAAIGYGGMTAQKAVVRIRDEMLRLSRAQAERQAAEKAAQEAILPGRSVAVARAEAPNPSPSTPPTALWWRGWTTAW